MFVGACQEIGAVAFEHMVAGDDICGDGRVGVPEVGRVIHVIDGCCDVESVRLSHSSSPLARSSTSTRGRGPRLIELVG